ncbi:MAG: NAD(P)/FAD-dependent oxidoreductase [Clostridia bacterium]|nr:NAD(P)/FAD-dependent oxidoreductase [Clostridia bacterium]
MSRIIVAGAGHGGLVAAMKLAEAGHDVTVCDRLENGGHGLDQKDFFDARAMEFAGLEIPDEYCAEGNSLTFIPLDDDVAPLTIPSHKGYKNLAVEREAFHDYLTGQAAAAGVKFLLETDIQSPIISGRRVTGIKTSKGDLVADLVIDACGVHSPVRNNLPAWANIDKDPPLYDILHTFRAYYSRVPGSADPEYSYSLYIKEDGTKGFRWCITEEDCVDVLLIRFPEITYTDISESISFLRKYNPQMGEDMIKGGNFTDIPIRQPLAVLTADGYAAIGDAAFMTNPLKGSGLAYSLIAGTLLANTVNADTEELYTRETLWNYEKEFYLNVGFEAGRLAVAKNLLPYMTAREISDLFRNGLVTSDDINGFINGETHAAKLLPLIGSKLKILNSMPELRAKLVNMLGWIGRYTIIVSQFPDRYDADALSKWEEKYNSFFDSIRRSDSEETAAAEEKTEDEPAEDISAKTAEE